MHIQTTEKKQQPQSVQKKPGMWKGDALGFWARSKKVLVKETEF